MTTVLRLEIVGNEESSLTTEIKSLYIPAYFGDANILEQHLPYLTLLKLGELRYVDLNDKVFHYVVEDGFVKNENNEIVVLSETIQSGVSLIPVEEEIKNKLKETKELIEKAKHDFETAKKLERLLYDEKKYLIQLSVIEKTKKAK